MKNMKALNCVFRFVCNNKRADTMKYINGSYKELSDKNNHCITWEVGTFDLVRTHWTDLKQMQKFEKKMKMLPEFVRNQ